jgi:hypothetical protein
MEPYRGLQPYTEKYEEFFFGREAEKAILIDKLLSEKLSLLFAATGVGKSSLLQAVLMPELKRPARENLDVVYYNDWVTNPLHGLPQKILEVLKTRGKIAADFALENPPLTPPGGQCHQLKQYMPFVVSLSNHVTDPSTSSGRTVLPLSIP